MNTGLETGPIAIVKVGVVVVAGVVQLAWLIRGMTARINVAAFAEQLTKLINATNAERAVKLCGIAPASPIARLARVGLEAQVAGASPRDAMEEALPRALKEARAGLAVVIAIGLVGQVDAGILVAQGVDRGGSGVAVMGFAVVVLAVLGIWNAMRWVAWPRELGAIFRVIVSATDASSGRHR
jgi:hypothetical protein